MATKLLRRVLLSVAGASAVLLAACGGGSVDSQFTPARIVVFGDAMADIGQNGARYTINNDGTVANWTEVVAGSYGRPLAPSSSGGFSYATGNARVALHPDAAGNAATPTVAEQVDTFLAASSTNSQDLVIFNAGNSDVVVQAAAVRDGTTTLSAALQAVETAGRELAAQVRRILAAGATHVVVVGPYNLGRSAWAKSDTALAGPLEQLTLRFNDRLLVSMVDLGDRVLYIDQAFYLNLITSSPPSYDIVEATKPACSSVDPGPGIGTGAGQVNSNLCDTSTLAEALDRAQHHLFADRVYPTPRGHQLFGDYANSRLRDRW